jgi:methyl-accepting chemotaxis protein
MTAKLPIAFVLLSLAVASSMNWMNFRDFKKNLVEQSLSTLDILTDERSIAIENWFGTLEKRVSIFATDPTVVQAAQGFTSTFGLLMDDPEAELQKAYIEDNPHPQGEKDEMARADDPTPYHYQHENFHPFFRDLNDGLHLYDVFLFDTKGNLMYSVEKEADFATDFLTGPFADSGLGVAFQSALELAPGETVFVDFSAYAPSSGQPAAFIATPIGNAQGNKIGVFAIQLSNSQMNSVIARDKVLGETGQLTMIASDFSARTTSRFDSRFQVLDPLTPNQTVNNTFETGFGSYTNDANLNGAASVGVAKLTNILGHEWILLGEFELSEVYAPAKQERNKSLVLTAAAMIVIALVGWLISRTFTNPLTSVVQAMNKISDRDYSIDIPDTGRKDEIGDLARTLELMTDRLSGFDQKLVEENEKVDAQKFAVNELGNGLKRLAVGDFTTTLDQPFSSEFDALREDYNNSVTKVGSTIQDLKQFSAMIEGQAAKMGNESDELSRRTENQAATLEETAAAIDQITGKIAESTQELKSAENLVNEMDADAKKGRKVVDDTTNAMSEIEKSSKEIGSIIRVVDDIAFQTNLLALNAGVEAARAGDAGRGFAVVATEVRELAMRSTEAVSQIKGLISTSATNVETGANLVRETEGMLLEIMKRIEGIATLIASVTAGATDQAGSITEINVGVTNLDRVTQQNALMVENSTNSVQALQTEAINLLELLKVFQLNDGSDSVVAFSSRNRATSES